MSRDDAKRLYTETEEELRELFDRKTRAAFITALVAAEAAHPEMERPDPTELPRVVLTYVLHQLGVTPGTIERRRVQLAHLTRQDDSNSTDEEH